MSQEPAPVLRVVEPRLRSVPCPRCRTENRPDRKFCSACGSSLTEIHCPDCGFANVSGAA